MSVGENRRVLSRYAIRFVLLAALLARLACLVVGERSVEYDEAIAFLAATGHETAYAEAEDRHLPPFGGWAPAREWKRFMQLDPTLEYSAVRDGLSENDIHPPLFFWMLHAVMRVLGVSVRTAIGLNLSIDLLTGLCLYALARSLFRDGERAELAVALWAMSPAVLSTCAFVRQYALLALTTVLTALACHLLVTSGSRRQLGRIVCLGGALSLGFLTHYLFVVLALGLLGWTAWCLRGSRERLVDLGVALTFACLLAFAANPHWLASFSREDQIRQAFTAREIPHRVQQTLWSVLGFWSPRAGILRACVWLLWIALAVAWGASWRRPMRWKVSGTLGTTAAFALWTAVVFVVPYILQRTPVHAMGNRYGAGFWPFLALALASLVTASTAFRRIVESAVVLGFVGGCVWLVDYGAKSRAARPQPDYAIVDSDFRGLLLPVIWDLPPGTPLLAGDAAALASLPDATLARPEAAGLYFRLAHTTASDDLRRSIERTRCTKEVDDRVVKISRCE
jgi:hypothetical protein